MNVTRRSALAMLAAASAAPRVAAATPHKIAFLLNGTPGEIGWNHEHARAIKAAQARFGDRAQIDIFENVLEWGLGDLGKINQLVAEGYNMIFGCAYGYIQSMMMASFAAPDVKFELCGGAVQGNNLATYSTRAYQGRAVEGVLAASASTSNRIGFIAPPPTPQVLSNINSLFLAARKVNPRVHLDIAWLGEMYQPEQVSAAARQLIDGGVDVLVQGTYGTEPMQVAQERGVFAFGNGSDMASVGPKAQLAAMVNNWEPYYISRIEALLNNSWTPGDTWGGLGDDMLKISNISDNLPNRIFVKVEGELDALRDGSGHAFAGPVRKQSGAVWLQDGQNASDAEIRAMDFLVDGIRSAIPS